MTEDNYISWHHYEGKLSDLFSLSSKPAFLVGAGISHDPPSNLPTGYQFTKEVLQQLLPTDQVEPILELTNPDRANMRSESDFLRFEQIMGHVQESIDPDLHVLDILSECTFPNSNHLFLAEAAKIGCPIITTNFDSLIEHALIALGLKKDEIYPVITREDWMMEPGNKIPVYKLHGSLMNVSRDLDTRSSIQATLRQISRGKGGESPILESWKLNTLKHILVNHDLIILGYSGYDDLDIIPTLKLIQSEKCIIWIAHSSDPRADIDIIDYIEDRRGWTFRESQKIKRGSERAYGHSGDFLHDVVDVGSRDGNSIFRIEINTANFLAFLRNTLILPKTETINKIEGKPVDTTLKIPELDGEIKMTLATKIWKGIERIGPAMEVGLKALEIIEMSDNDQNKAELYMNLGQIEEARGNLGIALTYYQKALSIFRKIGSIHDISLVLYDIGRIQYKESEPMVAMRSVQEGLSMSIDARDSFGHVVGLNLCGLIRRSINELNDALNDFRNAISAASEAGNILEKANSFRYIGETVIQKKLRGLLQHEVANHYLQNAYNIFEILGEHESISELDSLNEQEFESPNFLKLILFGIHTGRKALLNNFFKMDVNEQSLLFQGLSLHSYSQMVEEGTIVKVQLWYLSDQERFNAILPRYLEKSGCAITIFDIADQDYFNKIKTFITTLSKVLNDAKVPIIMLGFLNDQGRERQVESVEVESFAEEIGGIYLETTMKDDKELNQLLVKLINFGYRRKKIIFRKAETAVMETSVNGLSDLDKLLIFERGLEKLKEVKDCRFATYLTVDGQPLVGISLHETNEHQLSAVDAAILSTTEKNCVEMNFGKLDIFLSLNTEGAYILKAVNNEILLSFVNGKNILSDDNIFKTIAKVRSIAIITDKFLKNGQKSQPDVLFSTLLKIIKNGDDVKQFELISPNSIPDQFDTIDEGLTILKEMKGIRGAALFSSIGLPIAILFNDQIIETKVAKLTGILVNQAERASPIVGIGDVRFLIIVGTEASLVEAVGGEIVLTILFNNKTPIEVIISNCYNIYSKFLVTFQRIINN